MEGRQRKAVYVLNNSLLTWARYFLIFAAVLHTLVISSLSQGTQVAACFVLWTLLFLWVTQLRFNRFHHPVPSWMLYIAELGLASGLIWSYGGSMAWLLVSSLVSLVHPFRMPFLRAAYVLLTLCLGVNLAEASSMEIIPSVLTGYGLASLLLLAWLAQEQQQRHSRRQLDRLLEETFLKEKHWDDIKQELARLEALAKEEERKKISSDLHDDLGHRMVRMKMMMEAALRIAEQSPDQAQSLYGTVRDQLSDAMEAMRRTVKGLQPDAGIIKHYSLEKLMEECRKAGLSVDFTVSGLPYPLYPGHEYIFYRNAQEAITNAMKHGGAAAIELNLAYEPHRAVLTVRSDGRPPSGTPEPLAESTGMKGMRERLSLHGGELTYNLPEGGRFEIAFLLPQYNVARKAE